MQENQRVFDMALEVLARQATVRSERTGKPFKEVLEAILHNEAGRRLKELSEGAHRYESAHHWWQEGPCRKRAKERRQTRREEQGQVQQEEQSQARLAAWETFMQAERRELELRMNGQLARMLEAPLTGEPTATVLRLASEDRRQADEGLVTLMHDGDVFYKSLEELRVAYRQETFSKVSVQALEATALTALILSISTYPSLESYRSLPLTPSPRTLTPPC
jgi:hypothetical protein